MEAKPVLVKICAGTHCYLMGGSELQLFSEYLPDNVKNKIRVVGSACLGFCDTPDGCKPPFVMVNDQILNQATVQCLLDLVKKELNL